MTTERLRAVDLATLAAWGGYSADDVRPCMVRQAGGEWFDVDVNHPTYPSTPKPGFVVPENVEVVAMGIIGDLLPGDHGPPGLGDMVAAGLSAVGITKERVSKAFGRPCGCGGRQKALNELGRKIGIG